MKTLGTPASVRIIGLCLCLSAVPAAAQRTEENAVTSAGDAFGKTVGNEKIGLYAVDDVRGFNPVEAGNVRIEGLYFDQQDRPTPRLTAGSTVRVGITAQGYPFPAPTGIVDYRLRGVRGTAGASVELERTAYGGGALALDAEIPVLNETLGVTLGAITRRVISPQDGTTHVRGYAGSLAWAPLAEGEVKAFWSKIETANEDSTPTIFPAGNVLPPRLQRGQYLGQPWAERVGHSEIYGAFAKLPVAGFRLEGGIFRSRRVSVSAYADLLRGVTADGAVANRVIIADGNNLDDSISGELRLSRRWIAGDFRHEFYGSLRSRAKDRDFGGQTALVLGASTLNAPDVRVRPAFSLGREDQDRVRQSTLGLGYGLEWTGRGALSLSLSKSRYRKSVDFANPALPNSLSRADPWLYNIGGSVTLTKRLALYGGFVRGLEESLIAPEIAVNRSEAPPAILTQQYDAGLRFAVTPNLTLVAGGFSVRKPYYGVDGLLRFEQLGNVENRGLEISLAGQVAPGLTLVAGTVLLDPKISGDAVVTGRIGASPVGSVRRRSTANLDWKPVGQSHWSFDLAVESTSSRIGNTSNQLTVSARSTLALGTRYRLKIRQTPALIRVQVTNIFDEYGWLVSNSGGFTYSPGRAVTAQLVVDL